MPTLSGSVLLRFRSPGSQSDFFYKYALRKQAVLCTSYFNTVSGTNIFLHALREHYNEPPRIMTVSGTTIYFQKRSLGAHPTSSMGAQIVHKSPGAPAHILSSNITSSTFLNAVKLFSFPQMPIRRQQVLLYSHKLPLLIPS